MRFYDIIIIKPVNAILPPDVGYTEQIDGVAQNGEMVLSIEGGVIKQWSSYPGGFFDPNAPQIEFDMLVMDFTVPVNQSSLKIFGVSLEDISQSNDLNNCLIEIYGGMGAGLPLANPGQSGLLMSGQIIRAYGNWIGTEQTLNLMLGPSAAMPAKPGNGLTVDWKPKTPLSEAITTTLTTAFPDMKIDSSGLDASVAVVNTEVGFYPNITTFAQWLRQVPAYADVQIFSDSDTIYISNGAKAGNGKLIEISPIDLIGQPTWIYPRIIQVTTVMRADIKIGTIVHLPPTLYTSLPGPFPNPGNSQTTGSFQGNFIVRSVRHIGSSRSTDAMAWITIIEAGFLPS